MDNKNLPAILTNDQLMNLVSDEDKEIAKNLLKKDGEHYLDKCKEKIKISYYYDCVVKNKQKEINDARTMQMISNQQYDKEKQYILENDKTRRNLVNEKEDLSNKLELAEGCKKYGPAYEQYCNTPTLRISLYDVRHNINVKYLSIYPGNTEWKYPQIIEILRANHLLAGDDVKGYKVSKKGEGLIVYSKDRKRFMIDFKIYMNLIDALEKTNYRYLRNEYYSIVNK